MSAEPGALRTVVYAHYDPAHRVAPYVRYAVERLMSCADRLVFVSASDLPSGETGWLAPYPATLMVRANAGLDFASYRDGLLQLPIRAGEEIVLANDSVYGPFFELGDIFATMSGRLAPAWSLTRSEEIAEHMQSYFLCFGAEVVASRAFWDFWRGCAVLERKRDIILDYEVGLSRSLQQAGFTIDSYCPPHPAAAGGAARGAVMAQALRALGRKWKRPEFYRDALSVALGRRRYALNPALANWRELVSRHGLPLVKRSLFADPARRWERFADLEQLVTEGDDTALAFARGHLATAPG